MIGSPEQLIDEALRSKEVVSNIPSCVYLSNIFDLTPEFQRQTQEAYDKLTEQYGNRVQWSTKNQIFVWTNIFGPITPYLRSLPGTVENGNSPLALICGAGTLLDIKLLQELNPNISSVAIDLSEPQLIKGGDLLAAHDIEANGLARIGRLPEFLKDLPPATCDLCLMVATLQHLTKFEALQAVGNASNLLKPGAKMYAEIRFDPGSTNLPLSESDNLTPADAQPGGRLYPGSGEQSRPGRVFMDTVLMPGSENIAPRTDSIDAQNLAEVQQWLSAEKLGGEDCMRFFNTYSKAEALHFINECTSQFGLRLDILDFSPHLNSQKPPFIRMFFTKIATSESDL